jgi:hypothetical protein
LFRQYVVIVDLRFPQQCSDFALLAQIAQRNDLAVNNSDNAVDHLSKSHGTEQEP